MAERDESVRFGVLSVPAYAIRWFIGLFSVGAIYLTVANTLSVVIQARVSGWLEIQRLATEELVRAGGASLVGSVIIVEVGNMVLGEWIRQRRRQKALEEGKELGLKEGLEQGLEQGIDQGRGQTQAQWEAWNQRRIVVKYSTSRPRSSYPGMVPPSSASEVGNLVLGEWIRQRRRQKALEEGKEIGRDEIQSRWEAWNQRRQEAEKRGESFDEPPPGLKSNSTNSG